MNKNIPLFVLITFFLSLFNAASEDNKINIVSDKLNVEMDERKSTFTGNVYAHNKNLKVWSDKMIINLEIKKDEIK